MLGSFGSTATWAALVYWMVAPVPLTTVASTKVKAPVKSVLPTPLRGRTSMISGFSTFVASEPGRVLVRRIRHLLSSSVAWPSRLTWTTGVSAIFCSLIPATLEIWMSAAELR